MTRLPNRRLLALALAAGFGVPALAQAAEPFTVSDIRVDGLQRITSGTVFTYLPVERGDTVNPTRISDSVRALYRTGFFEDIQVARQGDILVFTVTERPAINRLTLTGNKDIKSDQLLKGLSDIGLSEGGTFDRLSLDRVTQELVRQYNNRGKYNVNITPTVSRLDRNRVDIAINIEEGKAAKIRHINLVGTEKLDEEQILDDNLPGSIIIAGSGAIGVEFAYVLKNFGVDVTIVEFLDRMVPTEDADVSKELAKHYKKLGVKVMTSTKVESVEDTGSGVKVTVTPAKGGDAQVLEADRLLSAIGFAPRTQGYGLESIGVELTERGAIAIDDYMRTNVDGIYAIGDVTAKLQLAHVAEAQGVVAAETIAGVETMTLGDYRFMPRATFCQPQVASFGLTEAQAKAEGRDFVSPWRDREPSVDDLTKPHTVRFRRPLDQAVAVDDAVQGTVRWDSASLDDLVIASFVSGPASTTLPMVIFSSVRLGVTPEINALATIIVALVTTGIIVAGVFMARQERIRKQDEQMAAASNA